MDQVFTLRVLVGPQIVFLDTIGVFLAVGAIPLVSLTSQT
jgi:hypothetical protein